MVMLATGSAEISIFFLWHREKNHAARPVLCAPTEQLRKIPWFSVGLILKKIG
jgi:hypothetical protein